MLGEPQHFNFIRENYLIIQFTLTKYYFHVNFIYYRSFESPVKCIYHIFLAFCFIYHSLSSKIWFSGLKLHGHRPQIHLSRAKVLDFVNIGRAVICTSSRTFLTLVRRSATVASEHVFILNEMRPATK